jgi:hypothetical protein
VLYVKNVTQSGGKHDQVFRGSLGTDSEYQRHRCLLHFGCGRPAKLQSKDIIGIFGNSRVARAR